MFPANSFYKLEAMKLLGCWLPPELFALLEKGAKERGYPTTSSFARAVLIEKLESLGYAIRPEWKDIYWGARTDLPNRTRERDKRKPERERELKG